MRARDFLKAIDTIGIAGNRVNSSVAVQRDSQRQQ